MFATAQIPWDEIPIEHLAAALAGVDLDGLSPAESVEVLAAHQRLVNHQMGRRARLMVEVCERHDGDAVAQADLCGEFAPLEVGTALTLTRRKAQMEVELAYAVVRDLPAIGRALDRGDLDGAKARVIVHGVDHLDHLAARRVVHQVLPHAPALTTGQLAARIRKVCLDYDPADATRRYERSVEDRKVEVWPHNDGTGDLWASHLPPDRLNAAFDHVDALARQLRDDRTLDQKRADVLLDLLVGRPVNATATPSVQVTVDLQTLIGLADRPADIPGWGPVIADIARQALETDQTGKLHVKVTDGDAHADVAARHFNTAQRRTIRHRMPTCVFPGCRRPAQRSDLDHTIRHTDGGPTHTRNAAPLCRFHHRAKDQGHWAYRTHDDGTITWTSPLGLTYTIDPRGP